MGPTTDVLPSPGAWDAAKTRRRVATAAVLLGLVVAAFEGTVVTSAMPTIVRELGGLTSYAWVFSAFLLASTLSVLVCGKLADAWGRRPVFLGGMALFLAGSMLCGTSSSFAALVAFRVVQGLGAGAIQPIAMTITADLYTLEERARIQAVFTTAWGGANVVGPVIGGWIVLHASWRWVFFVNVPVGALAAALLVASYRDPPRATAGPIGASGAILAGLATALLLFALDPHGRAALPERALAAGFGLAGGLLFLRRERRTTRPLLPAEVLADRSVRAGLAGSAFAGGILYASAAYVPLWVSAHAGGDALAAGASLVPLLVGWAFGSSFGVKILVRHGMRVSAGGGFAVGLTGALALALCVAFELPLGYATASLAVLGFGLGPAASTSLVGPQSSVAWTHRGAVTSTLYGARMLGGSLAVVALGAAGSLTQEPALARFAGIAVLAAGGLVATRWLAPVWASGGIAQVHVHAQETWIGTPGREPRGPEPRT